MKALTVRSSSLRYSARSMRRVFCSSREPKDSRLLFEEVDVAVHSLGEEIGVGLGREDEVEGLDQDAQREEIVLVMDHLGHGMLPNNRLYARPS